MCETKGSLVAIPDLKAEHHSWWCRDQNIKHINSLLPFFFPSITDIRHFINFGDEREWEVRAQTQSLIQGKLATLNQTLLWPLLATRQLLLSPYSLSIESKCRKPMAGVTPGVSVMAERWQAEASLVWLTGVYTLHFLIAKLKDWSAMIRNPLTLYFCKSVTFPHIYPTNLSTFLYVFSSIHDTNNQSNKVYLFGQ